MVQVSAGPTTPSTLIDTERSRGTKTASALPTTDPELTSTKGVSQEGIDLTSRARTSIAGASVVHEVKIDIDTPST